MGRKHSSRGQTAIEYLMNYAWAIALIIIVGTAIYGLDIGNIRTSIAASGSQPTASTDIFAVIGHTWTADSTNVSINVVFQNNGPSNIEFKNATVTEVDGTSLSSGAYPCTISKVLYPGEKMLGSDCVMRVSDSSATAKPVGTSYSFKIKVTYSDTADGMLYASVYTLNGKAQA